MQKLKWVAFVVVSLALAGCASVPSSLTQTSYDSIGSIGVDRAPEWNLEGAEYYSAATNLGHALGGITSIAIANSGAETNEEILALTMQEHDISLSKIALDEFIRQLNSSSDLKPKLTNSSDADATFKVAVFRWGLRAKSPFSAKIKPVVGVRIRLVDDEGTILWQMMQQVTEMNGDVEGYKFGEFLENPEILRAEFTKAIQIAMNRMGSNLVVSQ